MNSFEFISQENDCISPSNVPLINLNRLKTDQFSNYFNSKSYLIDAIHISSRIPIKTQHYISCSIKNKSNDQQINFQRIKKFIFNNPIKFNYKCPCKSQPIHFKTKLIKPSSSSSKKTSKILSTKKNPTTISSSSSHNKSLPTIDIKIPQINPSINITSHTKFGKSFLALYFQKYRFISPITNNKKNQFFQLLKSFN